MGLFDSLSVTEKLTAGLAVAAVGAIGFGIGTLVADRKHGDIQAKVKKFATVKSYLVRSLTAKGFCDDASLAVYLGATCPTELDLNQDTGEARGEGAFLYTGSSQPGSFRQESFATGEIARQLEKAYMHLLQWGHARKADGKNGDLKASAVVFYMKLLRQMSSASKTVFYTSRGLDFLEAIINAMHLTSLDVDVAHSRTDGNTARAFSLAIQEARTALKIAAVEMGKVSAEAYLKELRDVSRALMDDLCRHFVSVTAPRSAGAATVADYTTLSQIGWGAGLPGTLLQGIIYQIFGAQTKPLSSLKGEKEEKKVASTVSIELTNFLTALMTTSNASTSPEKPIAVFLRNLRKIKFDGDKALYEITGKEGTKVFKIPSGISPNLLKPEQFARFVDYLESLAVNIETTVLLVKFQSTLTEFAAAKGNESLYGEGMQSLVSLSTATETVYKKLLGCSKEMDALSEEAVGDARVKEYIEGQALWARLCRIWHGTGDADRGAGDAVAASQNAGVMHARAEMGAGLLTSLKKAATAFADEESTTPTLLELNQLALDLGHALALKRTKAPEKLLAVEGALQQLEHVRKEGVQDRKTDAKFVPPSGVPINTAREEKKLNIDKRTNLQRKEQAEKLLQSAIQRTLALKPGTDTKKIENMLVESKAEGLMPFTAVWTDHGTLQPNALTEDPKEEKNVLKQKFQVGMFLCMHMDTAMEQDWQPAQTAIKTGDYSRYKAAVDSATVTKTLPTNAQLLMFQVLGGGFYLLKKDKAENTDFASVRNWLDTLLNEPLRTKLVSLNNNDFYTTVDAVCGEIGVALMSSDIKDPLSPFCEAANNVLIAFVVKKLKLEDCTLPEQQRRAKDLLKAMQDKVPLLWDGKSFNTALLLDPNILYTFKKAVAKSRNIHNVYSERADQEDIFKNPSSFSGSNRTRKEEGSAGIRPELLAGLVDADFQQLMMVTQLFNGLNTRTLSVGARLEAIHPLQRALVNWVEPLKAEGRPEQKQWGEFSTEVLSDLGRCCESAQLLPSRSALLPPANTPLAEVKTSKTLLSQLDAKTGETKTSVPLVPLTITAAQFLAGAARGNATDQYALASAYETGQGMQTNPTEAVRWYEQAALRKHVLATYRLGWCYVQGIGLDKDEEKAQRLFKEVMPDLKVAALKGDADAQFNLARCYTNGHVVTQDKTEAMKWYRRAAEQGNADAQFNLGWGYDNGIGAIKDEAEALRWYRLAAEQGNAIAQLNLGMCYAFGHLVTKDEAEAVRWYRRAAEQGNAIAQNNLGVHYSFGNGVTKDETEAVVLWRRAAEQGRASAQNNLGTCYHNGSGGITKDEAEAVRWYQRAAEQGDDEAQNNLGICYKDGIGITKDKAEAVKWFQRAAEQGNPSAQNNLRRLSLAPNPHVFLPPPSERKKEGAKPVFSTAASSMGNASKKGPT